MASYPYPPLRAAMHSAGQQTGPKGTANDRGLFSPLRDQTYRHLFFAQVIALVGTGLTTVALALLAYDLAGADAGAVLGTALALKMIAYVGIAPVVGGLAHHLPRKAVLITLDIVRAAIVLCLPFVTALWQIYALVFLVNACSAGFTPLFQATIPDVLTDEDRYTRALSLSRLAYDLEALLSPLLAAAALVVLSYDNLFMANSVAFFCSALFVFSVALPAPAPTDRGRGTWGNISFGITAYLKTPRLRGLFALSWAVAAASASVIVNTVVVARSALGLGSDQTALLYGAAGGGSMVVALLLPRWLDRWSERSVMATGVGVLITGLIGASLCFSQPLGKSASTVVFPLVWVVLGAGLALAQTPGARVLRRSCSSGDRSAFFSAQFALSHGCWLICYPLAGWTSGLWGLDVSFAVMGLIAVIGLAAALLLWPHHDPMELDHIHPAIEHDHPHRHDQHHHHTHQELHALNAQTSPSHRHDHSDDDNHSHWHHHPAMVHRHAYVIDSHHPVWPH